MCACVCMYRIGKYKENHEKGKSDVKKGEVWAANRG